MSSTSAHSRLQFFLFILFALAALLLLGGADFARAQSMIHVDDNATGDPAPGDPTVSDPAEDGSVAHPFDAIQEAVDEAEDGDTVLVLDGEYRGEGNRNLDFGGRLITVRSQNGPDDCTIDCSVSENVIARGFYFHNAETSKAVVSGLTIRSGHAVRYGSHGGGGGWASDNLGGGIYSVDTSVVIENCVITECKAEAAGGGVYFKGGAPVLRNSTIHKNEAEEAGAGIRTDDCSPVIENCTITENETGSALGGDGTGVSCDGGAPDISECTISENNAGIGRAAGVFLGAGGRISNSLIHSNRCDDNDAGGLMSRGEVTLEGCTITENYALDGAGIIHEGGTLTIVNCVIAQNLSDNYYHDKSGATIEMSGPVVVINSTIVNNVHGDHPGPLFEGPGQDLTIVNSIVWNSSLVTIPSGASIEYSDVLDGWEGAGNIDSDPKFIDAGGGFYHLAGDSPCINAGSNEVEGLPEADIDGDNRIQAGRVDMGAFESAFGMDDDDDGEDVMPCPVGFDGLIASLCGIGACSAGFSVMALMCLTRLIAGRRRRPRS